MFWTVVGIGVLINGVALGGSILARTQGKARPSVVGGDSPSLRGDHETHEDPASRATSAMQALRLANMAAERRDYLQARQNAYEAVRILEGLDGSQALLSYAYRVLQAASSELERA